MPWDAHGRPLPLGSAQFGLADVPTDGIVEVRLPAPGESLGRIVGPDGRPVPGVRLTTVLWYLPNLEMSETPIPIDADGYFAVRADPEGSAEHIRIDVPHGYAAMDTLLLARDAWLGTLVLQAAGEVAGRFVAPGTLPRGPEGGLLHLKVKWSGSLNAAGSSQEVPIDAQGHWRVAGVPVGVDVTVEVPAAPVMEAGYLPIDRIEGLRAGDRDVEIRLVPGLSITGQCLEADGAFPRSELIVLAEPEADGQLGRSQISQENGRFTVAGLAPGSYRLRVGMGTWLRWVFLHERAAVAGAHDLRVVLPPRSDLRVRLAGGGSAGTLAGPYDVELWEAGSTNLRGSWWSFVGDEEASAPVFTIPDVPSDARLVVVVSGSRTNLVGSSGPFLGAGEVIVPLVKGLLLAGRVRREGADLDSADEPLHGRLYALGQTGCFHLDLDRDGSFSARGGVVPGRYELRYVDSDGAAQTLARDAEAGREDLDLVLR